MNIKIVTDSGSDITKEEAEKLGIELISMEVSINKKTYLDGDTISADEFYNQLEECTELPKTSQINPFRFEELFDRLTKNGDKVIAILLSSKISGTYSNAKSVESNYNNNVYVVDSYNAALGQKIIVLLALQLVREGKSFEEIIATIEKEKQRVSIIVLLNTLKYLKMGGRISPFVAFAGETLNLKPLVGMVDGEVKLIGKGRGFIKSKKIINELIAQRGGIDTSLPYGVSYSGTDSSKAIDYIKENASLINIDKDVELSQFGCTIGTHIGPNGIGIAFFNKQK
ncbi:MAG: DegV family protein [Bacilli bacterium]|nr:DegV family protein [Bacillales bacterium]MDY6141513.1 DegV family protein [Bacilli bacterium]